MTLDDMHAALADMIECVPWDGAPDRIAYFSPVGDEYNTFRLVVDNELIDGAESFLCTAFLSKVRFDMIAVAAMREGMELPPKEPKLFWRVMPEIDGGVDFIKEQIFASIYARYLVACEPDQK